MKLESLMAESRNDYGFCFVPNLVARHKESRGDARRCSCQRPRRSAAAVVHQALLAAAAAGKVELLPENECDRPTDSEKDDCLVGPSGERVLWVRWLGEG